MVCFLDGLPHRVNSIFESYKGENTRNAILVETVVSWL